MRRTWTTWFRVAMYWSIVVPTLFVVLFVAGRHLVRGGMEGW